MRKTTKKKRCKEALHCQERSKKERKIKNLKPIHSTKATKTIQKKEEKSRDTRQIEWEVEKIKNFPLWNILLWNCCLFQYRPRRPRWSTIQPRNRSLIQFWSEKWLKKRKKLSEQFLKALNEHFWAFLGSFWPFYSYCWPKSSWAESCITPAQMMRNKLNFDNQQKKIKILMYHLAPIRFLKGPK